MLFIEKSIKNYKNLRTSRKISVIMLIGIIITAQIASIMSMIAVNDVTQIISEVKAPDGYMKTNFDITNPDDMEIVVPYDIRNLGMYDLTDIEMSIKVKVEYTHNSTGKEMEEEIFSKTGDIDDCKAGNSLEAEFEGGAGDFDLPILTEFLFYFDLNESVSILVDIKLSAKYFYGLIEFTIVEKSLDLTDYDSCPTC